MFLYLVIQDAQDAMRIRHVMLLCAACLALPCLSTGISSLIRYIAID